MSGTDDDLLGLRRILSRTLRDRRLASGLTQVQAASRLDWSKSKFHRVEKGTTTVSVKDVQAMLELYGVDNPDVVSRLSEIARQTWLNTRTVRTRMEFAELVRQMRELLAAGTPLVLEEIAAALEEQPGRVADAIEIARETAEFWAAGFTTPKIARVPGEVVIATVLSARSGSRLVVYFRPRTARSLAAALACPDEEMALVEQKKKITAGNQMTEPCPVREPASDDQPGPPEWYPAPDAEDG